MIRNWIRRWRGARWDVEDFGEERAFHIQMETERNVAAGMSEEAARRKATRAFGNCGRLRQEYREATGWAWFGDWVADAKNGMRVLLRRKGASISAVLMLMLCLGASTAFFAALNSLVFEDLPFSEPERLVEISRLEQGRPIGSNLSLFNEYRSRGDLFDAVAFFRGKWVNIDAEGIVFRGQALTVTDGFFNLLGTPPLIGRSLEETTGEGKVWIGESAWVSQFGADESLIGSTLVVDGREFQVAGIAAAAAESVTDEVSLFLAQDSRELIIDPKNEQRRSESDGTIWARLKAGVTGTQTLTELKRAEAQFSKKASQAYRDSNDAGVRGLSLRTVQESRTQWARNRLVLLNLGVVIVLMVGTVNVAHLLYAQTNGRAAEFWVRRMLGAGTPRLVRQCLAEVCILVVVAWLSGLLIAGYGVATLESYSRELFRSRGGIEFGVEVWLYSALLALVCSVALGAIVGGKAVVLSRTYDSAKAGLHSTASKHSLWLRSSLAVGQATFTLVLLVSGSLLFKSFWNVTQQDFGFDEKDITTARMQLTDTKYEDDAQREAFKERLLETLRARPEVEGAALSTVVPTFGFADRVVLKHEQREGELLRRTYVGSVSEGYFETMGIALLGGRNFSESDTFGWQTPVIVDRRFAELFFPGEEVIGKRIALGGRPRNEKNWPVVIGVVEETRSDRLDVEDGFPVLYLPLKGSWPLEFSVFVKSRQPAASTLESIREAVESIDPMLPIYRAGSLESVMNESLVGRRGLLYVCLGMAAVSLFLSVLGAYGASAYRVSERLREFAIRIAIGASRSRVVRAHVYWDVRLAAFGIAVGVLVSWQVSRFLGFWLYQVEPMDAGLYFFSATGLLLLYSISSYIPSRKNLKRLRLRL